jgi:hypothetical protein
MAVLISPFRIADANSSRHHQRFSRVANKSRHVLRVDLWTAIKAKVVPTPDAIRFLKLSSAVNFR